jgi:hypothetical protein
LLAQRPVLPVAVWLSFTEELASAEHTWRRLLLDHQPAPEGGLCRTCTVPGSRSPYLGWPCSLWSLADAARRHAGSVGERPARGHRPDRL